MEFSHTPVGSPKKPVVTTATKGLIPFVKAPVKPKGFQMPTPPTWISGKTYAKKQRVTLEGKIYKSMKNDNISTPSTSAADWKLIK